MRCLTLVALAALAFASEATAKPSSWVIVETGNNPITEEGWVTAVSPDASESGITANAITQ